MKINRTLLVLMLVVLLVGLNAACQRNNSGVQASREEKAAPVNKPAENMTPGRTDRNVLTPAERDIAMKIEQGHLAELDLARLAKQHASNNDVKSFADMLEDDHNDALKDIDKILQEKGINESTRSKPADAEAEMSKLQKMSGAAFDREFINKMVADHQKTLDDLKSAQTSVQNPDLKDYINGVIPKVQKHLDKAQDLQSKLTGTKTR